MGFLNENISFDIRVKRVNPFSPNGVQHQYSPNTIHTLLRD